MAKATIDGERCRGCGLCADACPKRIIEMSGEIINSRGFHPACVINESACTGCAFCATMCPHVVIKVEK